MTYVFIALGVICLLYCAGILISGVYGSWFFLIWGITGTAFLALAWLYQKNIWLRLPGIIQKLMIAAILTENPDTLVVVSGGKGSNEPISEAQGMYEYLLTKGISPDRILLEDRSTNTKENLQFSRPLIPQDATVGIVTNNFHVYRSTRLAAQQGYPQAYGLSAPSDTAMQANNMFREFFGVVKDLLYGNMTLR